MLLWWYVLEVIYPLVMDGRSVLRETVKENLAGRNNVPERMNGRIRIENPSSYIT
uniref:Uncharacterized protein n=1 Tax=viral metagenome TaxID=1070528 RepID=A0A6C0AVE3_9ZZZZ|tara:strand:+ start:356 stop:520 length:165 start_codon:yes stop_codon:yes gene_type:complete